MIYASILAGGVGKRFGADMPKQFIKIFDKEIILYTINEFYQSGLCDKMIVSVPVDYIRHMNDLLRREGIEAEVIAGGSERNESLELVCRYIKKKYGTNDADILLSHDGVRPFVNKRIIEENIKAVEEVGFSATVIPSTDTIIEYDGGKARIPNRENVYLCQTPQGFFINEFMSVYDDLSGEEKQTLTDASKIYILKGKPVKMVVGEKINIKITSPQDVLFAKAIIESTN